MGEIYIFKGVFYFKNVRVRNTFNGKLFFINNIILLENIINYVLYISLFEYECIFER